jgi:hypothetical protein
MAVRAEEHALARLCPQPDKRPGSTVVGKLKLLGFRIKVMKLKSPVASGVATEDAFSSRLLDENSLQAMTSSYGRLNSTALTAVIAAPLSNKAGFPVVVATRDCFPRPILSPSLATGRRFQLVLAHPVSDRCQAAIHPIRNLSQR